MTQTNELLEEIERLQKLNEQLRDRLTCMCGAWVEDHSLGTGHTAVSVYDYQLDQARLRITRLETALYEALETINEVLSDDIPTEPAQPTEP